MAALIHSASERLQEDTGYVLQQLGGPDSHCLQAVEEMCRATCTTTVRTHSTRPHSAAPSARPRLPAMLRLQLMHTLTHTLPPPPSLQAGNHSNSVSFQRVTVPLLRLVTDRRWLSSPLSALSNPVLARIADTLDFGRVRNCLDQLAAAGSIADPAHTPTEVSSTPPRRWSAASDPVPARSRIAGWPVGLLPAAQPPPHLPRPAPCAARPRALGALRLRPAGLAGGTLPV